MTVMTKQEPEIIAEAATMEEAEYGCGCAGASVARLAEDERGMTTLEYALTALTAVAIATALYMVVSSGVVQDAFESIITDALNTRP